MIIVIVQYLGRLVVLSSLLAAAIPIAQAQAEFDIGGDQLVDVQLSSPFLQVSANATFDATFLFDVAEGWHIGWRYPGMIGLPTKVEMVELPVGIEVVDQRWSLPRYLDEGGLESQWGYEGKAGIRLKLQATQKFTGTAPFRARVTFLVCADTCLQGAVLVEGNIERVQGNPSIPPLPADLTFEQSLSQIGIAAMVTDTDKTRELRFPKVGKAQVEVFCEPDAVTAFDAKTTQDGLQVGLTKGSAFSENADILVVVRPETGAPFGVRLAPKTLSWSTPTGGEVAADVQGDALAVHGIFDPHFRQLIQILKR